jgi:hypothetical protein
MSYNSNLGYADLNPYVVSGQFTNPNNSSYAGSFGSNETQGGAICNDAMMRGGKWGKGGKWGRGGKGGNWKDSIRRKIKNITRKYRKMAKSRSKSMRKRLRSRYLRRTKTKSKSRNMKGGYTYKRRPKSSPKSQKGGYAQYGSNTLPYPASYSVGGDLPPSLSALASPPPVGGNAPYVDNYNRFTNAGFSLV